MNQQKSKFKKLN
ncbi:hypothetical protein BLA29_015053 [Euroglyphus maynei]|uniref:Uncharacterized protein n=1 Tax=Euroglyphus maynei TaxID=6958 RepID=A0A1Y3BA89_EURMA|nr:hypothetical protein BLA29_015053 [Euroglyphus maynei]